MQVVAELRYERKQPIGVGEGMNSTVYLSHDPQIGGELAIKEIPKSHFGNVVSRFFQEAQAMFAASHPNVVPVQYGCETPDDVALAMPYFANGSLTKRIATSPLTLSTTLHVAHGVLSGAAGIHQAGFLHLDIKPSNVLFSATWAPLISDFGQSRKLNSGTVAVPKMYLHVMPPETIDHSVGLVPSDIYQIGLLLYRAVNGEPFFQKQLTGKGDQQIMKEIVAGKFPDRSRFLPHVPKRLKTVIRKALATDPADRFQSAVEMADAMSGIRFELDWNATPTQDGMEWHAQRLGQPDLIVELTEVTPSKWSIYCWTSRGGKRRARGPGLFWKDSLSAAQAERHLREVFAELK